MPDDHGRGLWTASELAAVTGGRWLVHPPAGWMPATIGYRRSHAKPGALVFATDPDQWSPSLPDTGSDLRALAAADAVVVRHPPRRIPPGLALLQVDDTYRALQALGRAGRDRFGGRLIAVTGSVGKTTTKALLAQVFNRIGPTLASAHRFNNRRGVALTLAHLRPDTAFAVLEMGMGRVGSIGPRSRQARPHGALITAIEPDHLAVHDDLASVARTKAEIAQGVESGGFVVLPRDTPLFDLLRARCNQERLRLLSFGAQATADNRLLAVDADAQGSRVHVHLGGHGELSYRLPLPGRHMALNSLAVLTVCQALALDLSQALLALSVAEPVEGRGTVLPIHLADGQARLLDESFNANPASMRAALELLALQPRPPGSRRWAILGEMLELGRDSEIYHRQLAPAVTAAGVDRLVTCGAGMHALRDSLPSGLLGPHLDDTDALIALLRQSLRPGDAVLVKGSARSDILHRLVKALRR